MMGRISRRGWREREQSRLVFLVNGRGYFRNFSKKIVAFFYSNIRFKVTDVSSTPNCS